MHFPGAAVYMDKIATGAASPTRIDGRVASGQCPQRGQGEGVAVSEVAAVVLDRRRTRS